MSSTSNQEGALLPSDLRFLTLDNVAIDLEITSVCDAVCGFCPREVMPDKKRFMTMEVIERLADDLRQHSIPVVILCGIGESTLHPKLDQIVQTLADTGTKVEMTSHVPAKFTGARFEQLVHQGLMSVHCSVNAATGPTHQKLMRVKDFEHTVANIRQMIELRNTLYPHVAIHVSCVVCDVNAAEVEAFVDMWRPYRPTKIWLHPLNNRNTLLAPDVKPVSMDAFVEKYRGDAQVLVDVFGHLHEKETLCKIAKNMIFISAEGVMRLCAMDYRRTTAYGDLNHQRLDEMHREKIAKYLRGELNDFCQGCDFCPGGIRAERVGVRA